MKCKNRFEQLEGRLAKANATDRLRKLPQSPDDWYNRPEFGGITPDIGTNRAISCWIDYTTARSADDVGCDHVDRYRGPRQCRGVPKPFGNGNAGGAVAPGGQQCIANRYAYAKLHPSADLDAATDPACRPGSPLLSGVGLSF